MKKLVVFDTGTGGKIFAKHLRKKLKNTKIIERIDSANSPYGNRAATEITQLVENALSSYLGQKDIHILLACNTATTSSIKILRQKYPQQLFFGVEPMLKPASIISKNRKILVLATATTLKSKSYRNLKRQYCKNCKVLEPELSKLAGIIDQHLPNKSYLDTQLQPYQKENPDTIVLACTHYLSIEKDIQKLFPHAVIINPLIPLTQFIQNTLAIV